MRIIVPKRFVTPNYPLFFLAGPVRGGGDWQADMFRTLQRFLPRERGTAVSPCRWGKDPKHPLTGSFAQGPEERFEHQLDWERYYLERAGLPTNKPGCIIFWLPLESQTHPHPGPEPYAMDTRGELGEWRGRMMHNPRIHLVIGADPKFLGLSQIRRNFSAALGYTFPIYHTMEETARAAIELADKL